MVRKLEGAIKEDNPNFNGFIDLGSCVLHNFHNAFGKALEEYGKDIEQLCVDIHSLFKYSAAHCSTPKAYRWLSLGPCVIRILEQWDCICNFVKDLGKDPKTAPKTASYKRVAAMLTDEEGKKTKAQLEFICNVSPIFKDFLTINFFRRTAHKFTFSMIKCLRS